METAEVRKWYFSNIRFDYSYTGIPIYYSNDEVPNFRFHTCNMRRVDYSAYIRLTYQQKKIIVILVHECVTSSHNNPPKHILSTHD